MKRNMSVCLEDACNRSNRFALSIVPAETVKSFLTKIHNLCNMDEEEVVEIISPAMMYAPFGDRMLITLNAADALARAFAGKLLPPRAEDVGFDCVLVYRMVPRPGATKASRAGPDIFSRSHFS